MNKNLARKAQGFSLIEMMIAILISTIIIGVALSQLLASRTLFARQEDNSRIEENARYALDFLGKNARMAAFSNKASGITEDPPKDQLFSFNCGSVTVDGSSASFNPCTGNGTGTNSDYFAIWTNPPASKEETCSGLAVANSVTTIANLFYISDSQLRCRSYTINNTTNAATYINNSDAAIIDGIDNMQILYGITDQSYGSNTPTRYVSAATIEALANNSLLKNKWASVVSMRISLLVGTGLNDRGDNVDPIAGRNFSIADAPTINYTDGNLRKIYSSTVALNNAIQ
jgi:type IV pilus assembly protein PilW